MSPEPFVSRAKAPPAKRSEKGYGDENDPSLTRASLPSLTLRFDIGCRALDSKTARARSQKNTAVLQSSVNLIYESI